jgi:hypothetical protein
MAVRAKFRLAEVHHYAYGSKKYIFRPEYDTSIPEDQRFAKASPSVALLLGAAGVHGV